MGCFFPIYGPGGFSNPKISINSIIFNNPYKQHLPGSEPDPYFQGPLGQNKDLWEFLKSFATYGRNYPFKP